MECDGYRYLSNVDSPEDLRRIPIEELDIYCAEVRDLIIRTLAEHPGHLASNLGTVELACAIHYVYDSPRDSVIWDVGHQAYTHKIITGRRDLFPTLRQNGGISGFPRMDESPHDAFGTGHSSTSISAALGIAEAERMAGTGRKTVAVIGDGALTGGLAFEGIDNAGDSKADLLIILNDNRMSISPPTGALSDVLLGITTSSRYNVLKGKAWHFLERAPRLRDLLRRTVSFVKRGLIPKSNLFETLHIRYFGPTDGHDIRSLVKVLSDLRNIPGVKILHVMTVKGKGFAPAERGCPEVWHAPGRFDPLTGKRAEAPDGTPDRFQKVFGDTLLELARSDSRVVGVSPAMMTGCSMDIMQRVMPERCFDTGITEGHAVTFSAGLAAGGLVPFCNIYSSFMQRAYDSIVHDVALQGLHVVLCLDRAGLVGEDGATHNGVLDIACLSAVPGLSICAPMCGDELRHMMLTALQGSGPFVIRYPRGYVAGDRMKEPMRQIEIGRGRILREGDDLSVITVGTAGNDALRAAELFESAHPGHRIAVYDLRWVKPLDRDLIMTAAATGRIITVEDGVLCGGVGERICAMLASEGKRPRIRMLGIGDYFVRHATVAEQKASCKYDTDSIVKAIEELIEEPREL